MTRLFIIGNGYDLSKGMKTSYYDFKKWLETKYEKDSSDYYALSENKKINYLKCNNVSSLPPKIMKELMIGKNATEEKELEKLVSEETEKRKKLASGILFYSMNRHKGKYWNNFEKNLSTIPFKKIAKRYNIDHAGQELLTSLYSEIISLFIEWINSIENVKLKKKAFEQNIIKEIHDNDLFIIFNYTKTIETIFNVDDSEKFYHIHGTCENKDSIIIGHNCKKKSKWTNLETIKDYVNECYAILYKNPELVIKENEKLWRKIANSKEIIIYEYGWSCSGVDSDYIKEIISLVKDKKVYLYLNNYNNEGIKKKKQWIKQWRKLTKSCSLSNISIALYNENGDKIEYIK